MNTRKLQRQLEAAVRRMIPEGQPAKPFCTFDRSKVLTAGRYAAKVKGHTLTIWKT